MSSSLLCLCLVSSLLFHMHFVFFDIGPASNTASFSLQMYFMLLHKLARLSASPKSFFLALPPTFRHTNFSTSHLTVPATN